MLIVLSLCALAKYIYFLSLENLLRNEYFFAVEFFVNPASLKDVKVGLVCGLHSICAVEVILGFIAATDFIGL